MVIARSILFLFIAIETDFLRASPMSEFSHSLDPKQTSAIGNLVEIHGPVWIEGGFDSSHGGYHRTARESCRRGYAEAAFILVFCAPDAGVCRQLSFWGG